MKREKTKDGGSKRMVLFLGMALTFVVVILWGADVFRNTELSLLNWRFEKRGPKATSAPVVIVAIDDESMNGWTDEQGNYRGMPDRWTWPRTVYGTVVDNLKAAGAKVIVFDMLFSESSRLDPTQDQAFGEACKRAGNVIVGIRYRGVSIDSDYVKESRHKETPIPVIAAGLADLGVVHVLPDPDNVVREMPLSDYEALDVPSLDITALRQYLWQKQEPIAYSPDRSYLTIKDRKIPVVNGVFLAINYAGGAKTFPTFSFHHAYFKTMDMSVFKDKIVYIGSTSEILQDNWPTPFAPKVKMPGVEVHAHVLDTLLSQQYLKMLSGRYEFLFIILFGGLTSLLVYRVKSWQGMVFVLLEVAVYLVLGLILFLEQRIVMPLFSPLVSVFLTFTGITAYRVFVEEKRSREIRNHFSRYVSKNIVDEILKDPNKISLGGQSKEVTILFSDVRGFTAMSEKLSAEEVVDILNEYLTAMVDIVIANGGTLDKYVGDAIMAVWGSPLPDPDHRRKAVITAVQMMEKLQELRQKWRLEGKPPMDIGIGLNSGMVVAGNMGHLHYKIDYTVIGDEVNLAARLESANKELRSHLLISGSTFEGCKEVVDVVIHPPIKVKGKEKPVDVYEVVGWKGQPRAGWAVPLA